jgi:hypothetical protein
MQAYKGSGDVDPFILNLGTIWKKSGQLDVPRKLYPRYPFNRRRGGFQGQSGQFGEEENLLPKT